MIQIRLEEMHYIFSKQINGDVKRVRFNKIDIYEKNGIISREAFALKILPVDFYLVLEGSKTAEEVLDYTEAERQEALKKANGYGGRSTLSRSFKNEGAYGAKKRFQEVVTLLTHKKQYAYDTYENCKYRRKIVSNWESILADATEEEKIHVYERIEELIKLIPDQTSSTLNIKSKLQKVLKKSMVEALACLTLIACTLYIWNEDDITDFDLLAQDMILPPETDIRKTASPSSQMLKKHAQDAEKKLDTIRSEVERVEISVESAKKCYQKCLEILDIKPMDDQKILGETYFILYKCCKNERFPVPDGMTADAYLSQSQTFKYPEAMNITLEERNISLYDVPEKGISSKRGYFVINEENIYSEILEETLPEHWKKAYFDGQFSIDLSIPNKYFLCNKDTRINYRDLLKILDFYKRNWQEEFSYHVEVYILGKEEQLASLIDTAQQYMEDRIILIHIINEPKISAQYLLAKHPLFYSLVDYPSSQKEAVPETLHFVVLGTDECAEYLVRTAFWMMNFTNTFISAEISVVGKNAEKFVETIRSKCPGLRGDISDIYSSLESYKMKISSKNMNNFYSDEFEQYFETRLLSDENIYFAISSEDDIANLETAIALREKMIQYYVINGMENRLKNLPPIAFRCMDFHIASMSQKMVVNVLNHGNSWYNNHAIIPFGVYTDIYSWNGMVENVIEHLSKCIHLEYNNYIIPDDVTEDERKRTAKFLQSYYSRQYNKESSFAVALSMPYRLFNCIHNAHRILPESWNITNKEAYFNYDVLSFLADKLKFI